MTFDPASSFARELLSMFGKNTAIEIHHKYGQNKIFVIVARSKNVLAEYDYEEGDSAEFIANEIKAMKRFPRPRNMKRSWSPIRLTDSAREELSIRRATMNGYFV